MKKDRYKNLPEYQVNKIKKYVPAVTKVINEWDYLNVFPDAPEDHYEKEIFAISFHMGLLGNNRLSFLSVVEIVYIEMAHSFSLLEIDKKMCFEPAAALTRELGLSGD